MIHASKELLEAVQGRGPTVNAFETSSKDLEIACGGDDGDHVAFACCGGEEGNEDTQDIDCRICRCLLRAATDPVRWDYLAERGMVGL